MKGAAYALPLFCLVAVAFHASAERPLPAQTLLEDLAAGESHVWQISLAAGDFLSVLVDQRGIDVELEALAPDGTNLTMADSPNGRDGPERLTVIAALAGEYRVVVRSPNGDAPPGRYEIQSSKPRPATARDHRRHAAEQAQLQAHKAGSSRNAESYRESVRQYLAVVTVWEELGEPMREAEVLFRLGSRLRVLGESADAEKALRRALMIFSRHGDRLQEAHTWHQLGLVAWSEGKAEAARKACEQALDLWKTLDNGPRAAATLNTLGLIAYRTGQFEQALQAYGNALGLFRQDQDRRGEAVALHNIGGVLDLRGDPTGALDHYRQALEVARDRGDKRFEAEILHNQGGLYLRLGEAQVALEHYTAALPLVEKLGDRRRQAAVLGSLGILHLWLRDFDRALAQIGAALEIEKAIGDRRAQAWSLYSLGGVYRKMGQTEKALLVYGRSLELLQGFDDLRGRATILSELGAGLTEAGRPREALAELAEALRLQNELDSPLGQATVLLERGRTHSVLGDLRVALDDFHRALALSREADSWRRQGEALYGLAKAEYERGRLEAAREYAEQALALAESLRASVADKDLRATYFTSLREIYELSTAVLVQLARKKKDPALFARAFEVTERARARSFLDQLREARLDLRLGVDGDLLAEERRLRFELREKLARRHRLRQELQTRAQAETLTPEIEQSLEQLEDIQAEIRTASPRYGLLDRPLEWRLGDFQQESLDDETVLLEFFLSDVGSFLWVVTQNSVEVFDLPSRPEIESLVRQAYGDLSQRDPRHSFRQRQTLATLAGLVHEPLSHALGKQLRHKRLVIVADGALQSVPFGVLPFAGEPLIVRYEIVYLPSAMVLGELRISVSERLSAGKMLAVFADPVFSVQDPRVRVEPQLSSAAVVGTGEETNYQRLPWTRREADAIVQAVDSLTEEDRRFLATGFSSSVKALMSLPLHDYRILHFATHGKLDSQRPSLSSLIFSLVDEQGRPQDGFLRLHDIYSLKLNAELVVLSGCRTALGYEISGEGVQSLTRGFFHAGTPRVLASLWAVEDEATAELMARFYRALFHQNLSPAAALREAQISLWQERRFRDPFYWGAFVLQGDWEGSRE